MITRREKVEGNVQTQEAKKRWEAPEVTRLDFPKTAAKNKASFSVDSLYQLS